MFINTSPHDEINNVDNNDNVELILNIVLPRTIDGPLLMSKLIIVLETYEQFSKIRFAQIFFKRREKSSIWPSI